MTKEKTLTLGAGRVLFQQGETGGNLYYIESGTVELVYQDAETGYRAVVATLGEKSVLGTMTFLENDVRSAAAIAKTEIKYIIIGEEQRDKLLEQTPKWVHILVKDLSSSLRNMNNKFIKTTQELHRYKKKELDMADLRKELDLCNEEVKKLKGDVDTKKK